MDLINPLNQDASEEQLLAAMNDAYSFPGMYPVVVIMRNENECRKRLEAAITFFQDGDEYTITERASSRGSYISFHVQIWVPDARSALERKEAFRTQAGVVGIL